MKTAILLLSFLPSTLFSQEFDKERKIHFGVTTNYDTSSLNLPGFNLLAFGEYKKHQIAFGPRYTNALVKDYASYSQNYSGKSSSIILDLHYRYFLFNKTKRFNTFAEFSSEMHFRKNESTYFYDVNPSSEIYPMQVSYGSIFENSFNASKRSKGTYLSFYVGIGEEIKITKGLFANVEIGAGKKFGKSSLTIKDIDKDEVVYDKKNDSFNIYKGIALTGSVGLGYRI